MRPRRGVTDNPERIIARTGETPEGCRVGRIAVARITWGSRRVGCGWQRRGSRLWASSRRVPIAQSSNGLRLSTRVPLRGLRPRGCTEIGATCNRTSVPCLCRQRNRRRVRIKKFNRPAAVWRRGELAAMPPRTAPQGLAVVPAPLARFTLARAEPGADRLPRLPAGW